MAQLGEASRQRAALRPFAIGAVTEEGIDDYAVYRFRQEFREAVRVVRQRRAHGCLDLDAT